MHMRNRWQSLMPSRLALASQGAYIFLVTLLLAVSYRRFVIGM